MSNGIDPLKDVFHLSDQEKQALQAATSIIGSVSSIWGSVNSVKSVLTALGLLPQADQAAEMRKYINTLVQEFDVHNLSETGLVAVKGKGAHIMEWM